MSRVNYAYKVMKNVQGSQITEENLNTLGEQGWRLIILQKGADGLYDAVFIRE